MALAIWKCEEVPVSGAERIETTLPCLLVIQGFLLLLLFVYIVYFKIYKYVLCLFIIYIFVCIYTCIIRSCYKYSYLNV